MSNNQQAELDAILHGAAIASLDDRAFLRVTGTDATRWLNGMVTNSIQALAPGQGCYNFLLNAQGRILGDCIIYREPDGEQPAFVIGISRQQIETIQKHLDHFIIMDDVELNPMYEYNHTMLLIGPDARNVLRAIEQELYPKQTSFAEAAALRMQYHRGAPVLITTP